jgi:hypothetical protein
VKIQRLVVCLCRPPSANDDGSSADDDFRRKTANVHHALANEVRGQGNDDHPSRILSV